MAGETILLVEDEELIRMMLADALTEAGYTVVETGDGKAALAFIDNKAQRIGLILSDVSLPGLNGRELAAHARQARPGINILFVSGYPRAALEEQGGFDPSYEVMQKPFAPEALVAKVRAMLAAPAR